MGDNGADSKMKTLSAIALFLLSLTIMGCQTTKHGQQQPVKSNFGDSDVKLQEFSATFRDVKGMNVSTEEKLRIILEKAKELEAME